MRTSERPVTVGRRLLLVGSALTLLLSPRLGSPEQLAPGISVVCVAERPVAARGETVFVRAWVTNAEGEPLTGAHRFAWRADSGTISGAERAAWQLGDVAALMSDGVEVPVTVPATVEVEAAGHGRGRCELTVLVVSRKASDASWLPSSVRSERLTARMLLLRGKSEALGYGLRSYLVFGAPPKDAAERERYLRALEAYVRDLVPVEDLLAQNVRASQLNVTMVPAVRAVDLSANLNDPSRVQSVAAELLDAYDYARARVLLADHGISTIGGGPYLLSRGADASPARLLVDMTGVAPARIPDWVSWFCWLAGQERSWTEVAVRRFGLNLRNVIAVAGSLTPVVFRSVGRADYVVGPR